jgi:hypothetical protein
MKETRVHYREMSQQNPLQNYKPIKTFKKKSVSLPSPLLIPENEIPVTSSFPKVIVFCLLVDLERNRRAALLVLRCLESPEGTRT